MTSGHLAIYTTLTDVTDSAVAMHVGLHTQPDSLVTGGNSKGLIATPIMTMRVTAQ